MFCNSECQEAIVTNSAKILKIEICISDFDEQYLQMCSMENKAKRYIFFLNVFSSLSEISKVKSK